MDSNSGACMQMQDQMSADIAQIILKAYYQSSEQKALGADVQHSELLL